MFQFIKANKLLYWYLIVELMCDSTVEVAGHTNALDLRQNGLGDLGLILTKH